MDATLVHPASGAQIHLVGTSHLSASYGALCNDVISRARPQLVVLELDQERFAEADARLTLLANHQTQQIVGSSAAGWELPWYMPDAASWMLKKSQFESIRNEGGAIMLGSVYGADLLQAALAAAAVGADIVLADRPQAVTQARLTAALEALTAGWSPFLLRAAAEAPAAASGSPLPAEPSSAPQQSLGLESLQQGAQQALGRLQQLAGRWAGMALSSQPAWFGQHVHPVFYLVDNPQLQAALRQQGVEGVEEAAAAASRLLAAAGAAAGGSAPAGAAGAAAGGAAGQQGLAEDLEAIRRMVASKEQLDREGRCSSSSSSSSSSNQGGGGTAAMLHTSGAAGPSSANEAQQQRQQSASWGSHCPTADTFFEYVPSDAARTAYARAVVHERDVLLAKALWDLVPDQSAAAAADGATGSLSGADHSSSSSSREGCVVAVVGANHVPGIVAEWARLSAAAGAAPGAAEGRTAAAPGAAVSSSSQAGLFGKQQQEVGMGAGPALATAAATLGVGWAALQSLRPQSRPQQQQQPAIQGGLSWRLSQQQPASTTLSSSSSSSGDLVRAWFARRAPAVVTHAWAGTAAPGAAAAAVPDGFATTTSSSSSSSRAAGSGASRPSRQLRLLPRRWAAVAAVALPVAAAAWPLHQELSRMDQAVGLLQQLAQVNDRMLAEGRVTASTAGMLGLAASAAGAGA